MIKFETKLDSQAQSALTNQSIKKAWWAYLIFSLVFVLLGVVSLIGEEGDLVFGTVFIVIGVLFTPLTVLLTKRLVKKQSKTMPVLSEQTVVTYLFYADRFVMIQQKGDEYRSETNASYSCLFKVVASATHYYMYMSAQQCHVVPKESLVEGELSDLDDIFARNLATKFFTK